jgi:hypothetical protein
MQCSDWCANRKLANGAENLVFKVKVTLRLTVSQSICHGVKPKSWTFDQNFFCFSQNYCFFCAPSLARGRVCHVSVFVIEVYHREPCFELSLYYGRRSVDQFILVSGLPLGPMTRFIYLFFCFLTDLLLFFFLWHPL